MKITMMAHTEITEEGYGHMQAHGFPPFFSSGDSEQLAEFAGRLCYRSWDRPNPLTAQNAGYLHNIIEHKHYSTLEHASVTFLVEEVSRALTHELVRHRHFSFSQVSQRYVDSSEEGFVDHPMLRELDNLSADMLHDLGDSARQLYETIVEELMAQGRTKKEARGAARLVLPEGTTTSILVTGNHRSWREFIDKRYSKFADAEIRNMGKEILVQMKAKFPNFYQDFDLKGEINAAL